MRWILGMKLGHHHSILIYLYPEDESLRVAKTDESV